MSQTITIEIPDSIDSIVLFGYSTPICVFHTALQYNSEYDIHRNITIASHILQKIAEGDTK